MRTGLFGGSFDPIHRGHVEPVLEAKRELDLDRVIYLPTAVAPHKADGAVAPAWSRYVMVELTLLDEEGLEASAYEVTPGSPAFTIHTIEHHHQLYPRDDLVLLLGGDSLINLPHWYRWTEIVERVELGVLARPGFDSERSLGLLPRELRASLREKRARLVANKPVVLSSTGLRRRLAAGEDLPNGALDPMVLKYLRKYPNLYA